MITEVFIHRAEGPRDDPTMRPVTFTGLDAEARGNAWLKKIARTAPAQGGYDKTDVTITLDTGEKLSGRFDVQHTCCEDNDTDLKRHFRGDLLYVFAPERLPWLARDPKRLEAARRMNADRDKAKYERIYNALFPPTPCEHFADARIFSDGHRHCVKCGQQVTVRRGALVAVASESQ